MSLAVAETLVKRILMDPKFQERIRNASSIEKMAILKEEGYGDVTEEEVWTVGQKLTQDQISDELRDEELKHIVGGVNITAFSSAIGIAAAISALLE